MRQLEIDDFGACFLSKVFLGVASLGSCAQLVPAGVKAALESCSAKTLSDRWMVNVDRLDNLQVQTKRDSSRYRRRKSRLLNRLQKG